MTLIFSREAGPRERQLQRKSNNPLFGAAARITQQEILSARQQDQLALRVFMEQFRELVQQAVSLDANVESDAILMLKAQLEQQYALCTGLAGQPAAMQDALKKLIKAISGTLWQASKDDPHALEKLTKDEEHTRLHLHLCDYLIVSDILNPDEIISSTEQVPTLLNETEDSLQAALALFPPEHIRVLVDDAHALLKKIEAQGHRLPAAWQSLAQMESWIQGI